MKQWLYQGRRSEQSASQQRPQRSLREIYRWFRHHPDPDVRRRFRALFPAAEKLAAALAVLAVVLIALFVLCVVLVARGIMSGW